MNLASIFQYALTSIFALEQALPQKGLGATRKEVLMAGLTTLVKATGIATATLAAAGSHVETNTTISTITTAASEFIDATVGALNKSGVFASTK